MKISHKRYVTIRSRRAYAVLEKKCVSVSSLTAKKGMEVILLLSV